MKAPVTILAFLILATFVAFPAARASAQGAPIPDRGAEVAVRAGVAIPFGDAQDDAALDRNVSSAIPLLIEAGFRIDANLFVGARFGYAFVNIKNPNGGCSDADCDGSDTTVGLEAIYRFAPERTFAPWLGVGGGYEWLSADVSTPNASAGATVSGFQGLLMVGGDYRVNQQFVIGPAIEAAFGRFDSREGRTRLGNISSTTDSDIPNTAWHTWLTFGVRGAFGF